MMRGRRTARYCRLGGANRSAEAGRQERGRGLGAALAAACLLLVACDGGGDGTADAGPAAPGDGAHSAADATPRRAADAAGVGQDGASPPGAPDAPGATDATDEVLDGADGAASSADAPPGCLHHGTDGATSLCLAPTRPPEHYVQEALRYFDTLDVSADPDSIPAYSARVARWEWPPWLLLTGYERDNLIETGKALKVLDPSTVPVRDCRFFPIQPFARCRVTFEYEGGPCPIYEEFTFNDQGETTFIEAWSDIPDLRPMDPAANRWAEGDPIHRLSTRVPGLGNPTGLIDLDSPWMKDAAAADPEIADFVERARSFWDTWVAAVQGADPDFFAKGCGW